MVGLTLGALGVVFGDIGTSPLYAVQTLFTADGHVVHTTPRPRFRSGRLDISLSRSAPNGPELQLQIKASGLRRS
jgi:hypothetical protein